jgi:hypothetical protein
MIRNQVVTAQAQLGAAAATLQALNLSQPGLAIVTPGDIDPTVTNINRLMSTTQQRLAKQSHARRGVLATVHRTCGSNGLGDCYLSLRRAPNSASPEVHRINEGDKIRVVCQVTGENAHSTALGGWTTVWSRDARGRYMSNAYLEAPRLDPYRLTLPTCR